MNPKNIGIGTLKMKEYLYSINNANRTAEQMRKVLEFHRFDVLTWLIGNGVQIPKELFKDEKELPDY